jgi:hypothetical protein
VVVVGVGMLEEGDCGCLVEWMASWCFGGCFALVMRRGLIAVYL